MNAPRTRVQRRPVHGVLLLDKPLGLSSNDALQKAKWLLRAEKAGHTGTLDPLATGVLPLCFGAATKFSQLHLDADKTYEAVARLGVKTTHRRRRRRGDRRARRCRRHAASGWPTCSSAVHRPDPPGAAHAQRAQEGRQGAVRIRPRRRSRSSARRATSIVHDAGSWPCDAGRRRSCASSRRVSKGTYIRTLGEDIGEALGCGAHLSSLRRIATGRFDVAQCVTLEALEAMDEDERLARAAAGRVPAGRPHARHAGRRRCGPLPVAACAGAAPGPTRRASPSSATSRAALARHRPRQGRRTDPGAAAEPASKSSKS